MKSKILGMALLFLSLDGHADSPAEIKSTATPPEQADLVLVEKSNHRLTLFKNGKTIGAYSVVFGGNPIGHKERQGDGKTPEGRYMLYNKNAHSRFYKSFHISYPNASDIAQAKAKGVSPGGDIMIHGQKNGFGWISPLAQSMNWTKGCIALKNDDIDRLWMQIKVPVPIEIKP